MAIVCKSASEIEKMRRSGGIVREVLDHVKAMVAPGVIHPLLSSLRSQTMPAFGPLRQKENAHIFCNVKFGPV